MKTSAYTLLFFRNSKFESAEAYNETANLKQHENFRIHVFVFRNRKFEAAEAFSHTLYCQRVK